MKTKHKTKKQKIKSCLYLQDSGIFEKDVLISINKSKEDTIKFLKKFSETEDVQEQILSKKKFLGVTCLGGDSEKLLIMIPEFKMDTLIHELHHTVYLISNMYGFNDEMEAQAYLFEYFYKNIMKRLE